MSSFLTTLFQDTPLRSPQLVALQRRLSVIYNSRYTIPLLLILGIVRAVVFLLAYPPANGADHLDYFLHAAVLSGQNLPTTLASTVPLYPVLISIFYYGIGSFPLLIGVQLAMSVVGGMLYYIGLRRFSPALAFICALVITGDAQTGILYSFTSTEPLYLFLLAAIFCLFLIQVKCKRDKRTLWGDIGLGILLFAVTIARTVGRYLYLPLGILFLIGTRDWRRGLALAASFVITSLVFNALYEARLNALAPSTVSSDAAERITNINDTMVLSPLFIQNLLSADNGAASAQLVEYRATCADQRLTCVMDLAGGQGAFLRLVNKAYVEMIRSRTLDYAQIILADFSQFLSLSGQQFSGSPTPVEAQCQHVEATVQQSLKIYESSWMLYNTNNLAADVLENDIRRVEQQVCPPLFHQPGIQALVDGIAFRYRSLGRPQPILWYGALVLLILLIPWARRFWFPLLTAGIILLNHAAISALLVNVQPRYVVVTNPVRVVLLFMLGYVVGMVVLRVIDGWLSARQAVSEQTSRS